MENFAVFGPPGRRTGAPTPHRPLREVKVSCDHPYASVQHEGRDGGCECCDPPEHFFSWCESCRTVLHGVPNPIPRWWPKPTKALAADLTGFPIEPDPVLPARKMTKSEQTIGDLLLRAYSPWYIEQLKNLTSPFIGGSRT
jgi:hypothetical protein